MISVTKVIVLFRFYYIYIISYILVFVLSIIVNPNYLLALDIKNIYSESYKNKFLPNLYSPDDIGNIIPQGIKDLKYDPGGALQNDGTFLFQTPEGPDINNIPNYYYQSILGTNASNIVRFKGNFIIDKIDLRGGNNTIEIAAGSKLRFHPITEKGLDFLNVSNFIIEHGVLIDSLKPRYISFDMNITFTSPDSSDANNDIILKQLSMFRSDNNPNLQGTININNAKVIIEGKDKFILTQHNEVINLKDASIGEDNKVDTKTISTLVLNEGMSNPGGNNAINMGKYSQIIVNNGAMEFGGSSNVINMNTGSHIKGQMIFRQGNVVVNIAGGDKDSYLQDTNKINIDSLILGQGHTNININNYANFNVVYGIATNNGTIDISVGKGSVFTSKDAIRIIGQGSNSIRLEEESVLNTSIEFNKLYTNNNNVIINTGNSFVTVNGSITGSGNNDQFTLLGDGLLTINAEPGAGIDRFNFLNLGQSRIEFEQYFRQTIDSKITINLKPHTRNEDDPRLTFKGLGLFDNNNLDITFKGVSKYLYSIGDEYSLILLRNGRKGEDNLSKLADIGINNINFKSALYKLDYKIDDGSDLQLKVTKYRTFKEAVSEQEEKTEIDSYIVQMGEYLDRLLVLQNLKEEHYDILDKLAMLDVEGIRQNLKGLLPLNNVVLFNANSEISNNFKQVIINKSPYKIVKNDLSFFSNVFYSKSDSSNTKNIINGAKNVGKNIIFGAEYSAYKFLKLGLDVGYSKSNIASKNIVYQGDSNQYYYGIYSNISITNNLVTNVVLSYLNSKYSLSRTPLSLDTIFSKPSFNQTDLDILLLYKIKLSHVLISPFISFTYVNSKMSGYNENGFIVRSIDSSIYKEFKTGIGLKSLAVLPLEKQNVVIPSISLGLYNSLQNVESTNIHTNIDNVPIKFYADQDYGGLTANFTFNVSYVFKNSITFDVNVGTNINSKNTSYNLGLSANILL